MYTYNHTLIEANLNFQISKSAFERLDPLKKSVLMVNHQCFLSEKETGMGQGLGF
jgi:hypothetical protein